MSEMPSLVRFFKALGDNTRLNLIALLAQQTPGKAMCVNRLAHELGVTPSAISQHLRVLKDLGLVHGERVNYRIHYYLDRQRLAAYYAQMRALLGDPQTHYEDSEALSSCDARVGESLSGGGA